MICSASDRSFVIDIKAISFAFPVRGVSSRCHPERHWSAGPHLDQPGTLFLRPLPVIVDSLLPLLPHLLALVFRLAVAVTVGVRFSASPKIGYRFRKEARPRTLERR